MLYRLGESQQANRFVLKGAMLLMTWLEEPPRLTRERDLQPGDRFDQGLLQSRRRLGHSSREPSRQVRKARVDDCLKVRYLSEAEETRLRKAIEDREERRRAERDTANHWRAERGYVLLPSLRDFVFADHVKPLILLSINTGCRRGELFDLTWSNVNLDRRILTVTGATAKSRRTRHIPLNREATSVLLNWRAQSEDTSGLVFVNEHGERFDRANSSWRRLLKQAQITEFRWHDMRHHFASRLAMGGVDPNTIRELLGHSDYTMTLRYAHLAPEFKLKAVEVLDEASEAALGGAKVLSLVG